MDLKPVETRGPYKNKYVKYKDMILELNYAKESYFKDDEEYEEFDFNKLMNSRNKFVYHYRTIPSNEKMLSEILKKREQIYKQLNLNQITGKNADIKKAYVLFDYMLSKKYNMTVMEQGNKLCEDLMRADNYYQEFNDKVKDLAIRFSLSYIYQTLILNHGVCSNFTQTLQFLLNGQGINSYHLSISEKNVDNAHALNLVEISGKGEKQYYLIDATLQEFMMPKNYHKELNIEDDRYSVNILKNDVIKPNIKDFELEDLIGGMFEKEEVKQMIEHCVDNGKLFKNEINDAKKFIKNGYRVMKEVNEEELQA